MSDVAIRMEGLGKKYNIGEDRAKYDTLRDKIVSAVTGPFRRARKLLKGEAYGAAELDETIWALRDVTLEIERGEVVGVVGRNGAGKSTLLKILARITEPTEGYAEIRGRSGSLLEVGTGFHPELTGRENVYLNGAVLGMTKAEIDEKFEEIVDFAGTRKFLDTPVKHYSSGMRVRLAFAVAAHLDPEILLIDEVLSVGDAEFQRKCLGKMNEVADSGRTVVFVSHNMSAVTDLCERAILLEDGRVTLDGDPETVVGEYLTGGSEGGESTGTWERPASEPEDADAVTRSVRVLTKDGRPTSMIPFDQPFDIEIGYELKKELRDFVAVCGVWTHRGLLWQSWDGDETGLRGKVREPGPYTSTLHVPAGRLRPGRYHVYVCLMIYNVNIFDLQEYIVSFEISHVGYPFEPDREGLLTPVLDWTVERRASDGTVTPLTGAGDRAELGEVRP